MPLVLAHGVSPYKVQQGTVLNPFPVQSLQTFASDLTVIDIEGSKYFKAIKGDHLLITGYDFPTGWTKGFPYKSAATIDIFEQTGVPVVSLFQNFDYKDQFFCKHSAQVVDVNGIETFEPRVSGIVAYSEALTGDDLTAANTYFAPEVEDTTNVVYVDAVNGSNDNDGSKITPWKSLEKARVSSYDGFTVYLKSSIDAYLTGNYNPTKNQLIIGTGKSVVSSTTGTYAILAYKTFEFNHIFLTTQKDYILLFAQASTGDLKFNKCRFDTIGANGINLNDGDLLGNFIVKDSVLKSTVLNANYTNSDSELDGNLIINTGFAFYKDGKTVVVKNNKFISPLTNVTGGFITANLHNWEVKGNIFINNNAANFFIFTAVTTGQIALSERKFHYNYIKNDSYGGCTIDLGSELAHINALDNSEIIGNRIIGSYVAQPETEGSLHSVLAGTGINDIIKHNYVSDARFGIVVKTGLQQAYTSGGVSFNIVRNNVDGIYFRGVGGANCFNNTIINDAAISARAYYTCVNCDENSVIPGNYSENIIIKNNIMICSVPTSYLIVFDAHAAANGCTADYNIYYSETAKPFLVGGVAKTFAEWQALGHDAHSIMIPTLAAAKALFVDYDNGNFALETGSAAFNKAVENVGYTTGLSKLTTWGNESKVPIIVTAENTLLAVGAIVV